MIEQIGPQKLLEELKAQAPRYAKLLPDLPRLLTAYLQRGQGDSRRTLDELLVEQKRTNKLLQGLIYSVIGFTLGLLAMQFLVRVRLF